MGYGASWPAADAAKARARAGLLRAALVLPCIGIAPARSAQADLVFTSSGSFSPGTGATAVTNGVEFMSADTTSTLTITFTGGGADLTLLPSYPGIGTFYVTSTGSEQVSIPTTPTPTTFTLTIDQTAPPGESQGVYSAATLQGDITVNNGTVSVYFPETSVTIDSSFNDSDYSSTYTLQNLNGTSPNQYLSLDVPTMAGQPESTTVEAKVDGTDGITDYVATPEPAGLTLAASGAALLLAGYFGRRRARGSWRLRCDCDAGW